MKKIVKTKHLMAVAVIGLVGAAIAAYFRVMPEKVFWGGVVFDAIILFIAFVRFDRYKEGGGSARILTLVVIAFTLLSFFHGSAWGEAYAKYFNLRNTLPVSDLPFVMELFAACIWRVLYCFELIAIAAVCAIACVLCFAMVMIWFQVMDPVRRHGVLGLLRNAWNGIRNHFTAVIRS